jgi:hypothetical protein
MSQDAHLLGFAPHQGKRLLGKLQTIIHDEEFSIWFHIPFEDLERCYNYARSMQELIFWGNFS